MNKRKLFSEKDIKVVKNIIISAGDKAAAFTTAKSLGEKYINNASSIVTEADIATENYLRKKLNEHFPTIGFYSEESFKNNASELNKEYCWVVDPIDGTLNYSRGLPIYAVSVGLRSKNESIFGGLYFPKLQDYYWAQKYAGAYLNKKRLHVRDSNSQKLFGAFATSLTRNQNKALTDIVYKLNIKRAVSYCTVYNYAQTARGSYDFAVSMWPALWDIAACEILIAEAGGVFTFLPEHEERKNSGDPYYLCCIGGPKNIVDQLTPELKTIFQ